VHVAPAAHVLPHVVQFEVSIVRSTHAVPHIDRPGSHWHAPATQLEPAPHALPHEPQFMFVVMSVQTPLHDIWLVPQAGASIALGPSAVAPSAGCGASIVGAASTPPLLLLLPQPAAASSPIQSALIR
jgi:hypothetical protein